MQTLVCALVFCIAGLSNVVAENEAAEELLMRAEAMVEAADGDMSDGRIELAGRSYGLAQRLFKQLAEEHPKWHDRHVQSRLEYCDKRIEKVVSRLLKEPAPVGPPPPPRDDITADTPGVLQELGEAHDEMEEVDDADLLTSEIESTRDDLETHSPDGRPVADVEPDEKEDDSAAAEAESEKKPSGLSRVISPFRSLFGGRKKAGQDDEESSDEETAASEDGEQTDSGVEVAMVRPDVKTGEEPARPREEVEPAPGATADPPAAPVVEADLLRVLLRAGESEKAKTLLIEALTDAPENRAWRLMLGIAYCQNGEFEKAKRVTKELLREDRTNARAHVVLGTAYLAEGNVVVAKDQMQLAVDLDPKLGEAHYNLARIWVSVDPPDVRAARVHYERALALGEAPDAQLEDLLR